MLTHLHISNYALIDNLDIDLSEGFTVITGETGAGKSIILGALNLLAGQRADNGIIKQGEKKCIVEAEFTNLDAQAISLLEEEGLEADDSCILRREFLASGKSRAFVNDSPASVSFLKTLSEHLIDIHSQHQNLLLSHEDFLLDTLDSFVRPEQIAAYSAAYATWRKANAALLQLNADAEQSRREEEFLRFQYEQLHAVNLQDDELEELEAESNTLEHASEIKEYLFGAANSLLRPAEATAQIYNAETQLNHIQGVFPAAAELSERLHSVRIELDDIVSDLQNNAESVDVDPTRLQFVSERLSTIYSLLKRHQRTSVSELISLEKNLGKRLALIDDYEENLRQASQETAQAYAVLQQEAQSLTAERQRAASDIATAIENKIKVLGMPFAKVVFSLTTREDMNARGADIVTLLFTANNKLQPHDVASIASGGEISRLMLALKSYLSSRQNMPTIIFDEIDSGVSGTLAEKMALEMQEMATSRQVVCITHLPQIAARGTHHFRVYKNDSAEGATSHIALLSPSERIEEIANMLSGETLTDAAINNAKSLLNIQ